MLLSSSESSDSDEDSSSTAKLMPAKKLKMESAWTFFSLWLTANEFRIYQIWFCPLCLLWYHPSWSSPFDFERRLFSRPRRIFDASAHFWCTEIFKCEEILNNFEGTLYKVKSRYIYIGLTIWEWHWFRIYTHLCFGSVLLLVSSDFTNISSFFFPISDIITPATLKGISMNYLFQKYPNKYWLWNLLVCWGWLIAFVSVVTGIFGNFGL